MQVEGRWGVLFEGEAFEEGESPIVELAGGSAVLTHLGVQRRGRYQVERHKLTIDFADSFSSPDRITVRIDAGTPTSMSGVWSTGDDDQPMDEPVALVRGQRPKVIAGRTVPRTGR